MNGKKLVTTIFLIIFTGLGILFLSYSSSQDNTLLKSTFEINAVYYEEGYVQIEYWDKSENTNSVVMEILGMSESYQKTFHSSLFQETVDFPFLPKYGWETHPITFLIDHKEFGQVSLKTEIHPYGESPPEIIYGGS